VILVITLASLAALSLGLLLWQVTVAARFPLHQRKAAPGFTPGISVLKPLKGCDSETPDCLRSWLTQEYDGPVQILFGVAASDRSASGVVSRLIADHPHCRAQVVICHEELGTNAKVSKLIQLERLARHEMICVSDADVWVPPDFLSNAVAPLRDPATGLVNCFYRTAKPGNLAMRWEAFATNADFWSQVLQSSSLKPVDFALGAAMMMHRWQLSSIGGFGSFVNHLADDYQLGKRVAKKGQRIEFCGVVVECRSAPGGFKEVWLHQLRWARTIRTCEPAPFFCSILSNPTLWPLLWLAVAPSLVSGLGAGICVALRMASGLYLEQRMNTTWTIGSCVMAPIKDLLQVVVWAAAFTGRQVTWRGERYCIQAGGKLAKIQETAPLLRVPVPDLQAKAD
jgi:ceramide glucosyltransferase